ncbi:hypothetical protein ABT282_35050 [Streptomyces sp. NPDC000927]|uniref:hypothetical protein n=1 Tax=Streptomyces sp. NPDC000927 TaxID=3154371 RepID=UPI00332D22AA
MDALQPAPTRPEPPPPAVPRTGCTHRWLHRGTGGAAAAEPGVRSLGDVKDHTGRTGYAVALPRPHEPTPELRLIFGKSTGMPLGTEKVATRGGDGVSKLRTPP